MGKLNQVRRFDVDNVTLCFIGDFAAGIDRLNDTRNHQLGHHDVIANGSDDRHLFKRDRGVDTECCRDSCSAGFDASPDGVEMTSLD